SMVLAQLEAPLAAAAEAFRIARAYGVPTILNPSPATELDDAFVALVDYLVPNEHEAAVLADRAGTPRELATRLAERFPETTVLVTAGAAGVFVSSGEETEHIPAPLVDAVDTTGAGDAFVAAFAVRLRAGDDLSAAVRFAVSAASVSVTREGTVPAFAEPSDLVG